MDQVVELVGGGFVIDGAYPPIFLVLLSCATQSSLAKKMLVLLGRNNACLNQTG